MKNIEIKKYVIPNLPYVMMFWIFSKIAESYRLSAGADVVTKAMAAISDLGTAITQNPLPSFHPRDLLFGIAGAAAVRAAVYFKGKNGTTTYPLTTQVLGENTWTPEIVESRQKELMGKFIECWRLEYIEDKEKKETAENDTALFYISNKRGADSLGYPTEGGFVVKAGSKMSDGTVDKFEINYPNAYRLRESLCGDGVIVDGVFHSDYEFESISLAASLILGRNARGQKEWVDSAGIPYDECIGTEGNRGEFNINDESTYGALKVGALAFELFKKVFESGNITDEEIEKFKGKEYSKQLFSKTDYPILADNREDNRGKSNVIRYRKEPIVYGGKNIYFTTQWFAGNRNDVISWYRKHL